MNKIVGKLNSKVIELLGLEYEEGIPIILGDTNIRHMQNQHPEDYKKYGQDIVKIIEKPTYIARNPKQNSIEYIKEYKNNNELVLVAVRVSKFGKLFARTLFIMTDRKKNIYLSKNYAKKYS